MDSTAQDKTLRVALVAVGLIYIVALYPLTVLWPDGFMWMPRQAEYEQMILSTFAVLGVYLLIAARAPHRHRSLIGFAAWSTLGIALHRRRRPPESRVVPSPDRDDFLSRRDARVGWRRPHDDPSPRRPRS